jgi:hypothetical protein
MKTAETLSESSRIIVYTNFAGLPILRVIIDPTGPSYTYSLVDPVTLTNLDKDGRTFDQITSKRTTGSGALSPTDTFVQTDWQTWTNTQYDNQHQTTGQSAYFLIPSSGSGTVGTNYGQTTYGYDAMERQNRVVAPGGTITRTVWTTPQWVASVWIGTNDTGAVKVTSTVVGGAGRSKEIVERAEDWRCGGLSARLSRSGKLPLSQWPVNRPANWMKLVNAAVEEPTLVLLRDSVNGGKPFGSEQWVAQTARRLGLEYTLRGAGRPKKNAIVGNQ